MFKRRYKLSFPARFREVVWPSSGWRRTTAYFAHRVARLQGTSYSIAAGLACGIAVSFTPFIGLHFVIAAALAWIIGGNVFASAVGTAIGNPWTFPLIWYWIYHFGKWIMGIGDAAALPDHISLQYIFDNPWPVLLPMVLGGVPTAVVAWFVCYWPLKRLIIVYRRHRIARRLKIVAHRRAMRDQGKKA